MSDKVDFRGESWPESGEESDRVGNYITMKDKAFLCIPYIFSMYIPSNKVANYVKQKLTDVKGKLNLRSKLDTSAPSRNKW